MRSLNILSILLFFILVAGISPVFSQPLQTLDYQFMVRDRQGNLVTGQEVTLELTVYKGDFGRRNAVYTEKHDVKISNDGLVKLRIGTGSSSRKFSDIVWDLDTPYYVRAVIDNIDVAGGTFEHSSRLIFYTPSLFSGSISNLADPFQGEEEQKVVEALTIEGDRMYLSNGSVVELPEYLANSNSLLIKAEKRDVSCYGEKDGSVDVTVSGGNPPYDFYWSNGKTTEDLNGLKAGEYQLYVTDSKGFTAVKRVWLQQPDSMHIDSRIADVSGIDREDGRIELDVSGGRPPYSYEWSNGSYSKDQAGLSPGPYKVRVTSESGCSVERSFLVREPVNVRFDKENVSCYGENTGSIRLHLEGGLPPYEVRWSNNRSGYIQRGLPAGKYYVYIKDSWGYTVLDSVSILQPYPLKISTNVSHIEDTLKGGMIELDVQGGMPPYHYMWSTTDTTEDLNDVQDGVYSVQVVDNNSCEARKNNIFVYRMMTDSRDSRKYKVITIGTQVWTAENMNYGKQINSDKVALKNGVVEKFCYNDDPEYCEMLGGLYTWNEMMRYSKSDELVRGETQGICPDGWHIPTADEWKILADYLGGEMVAGNRMKNYEYWPAPEGASQIHLDLSGFSAYPAGRMDMAGESYYLGKATSYWSATKNSWNNAWHRTITSRGSGLYRNSGNVGYRFSVRCVKD